MSPFDKFSSMLFLECYGYNYETVEVSLILKLIYKLLRGYVCPKQVRLVQSQNMQMERLNFFV